jgi:hypothetical protein
MKVALCFIISYSHILNKEQFWIDWIKPNQDIINIYFHYKDINQIASPWIKLYTIPPKLIQQTTYFNVVPAYMSLLSYAFEHDKDNVWFCLLTDSCVPIISPEKFRKLFFDHYQASIIKCKPSYWDISLHRRANLRMLNKEFWLANDPWFTLCRKHVHYCILFVTLKNKMFKLINEGGLANESIFAIILQKFKELKNPSRLINDSSTIADWARMSSPTSPYVFRDGSEEDTKVICNLIKDNKFTMFLRKVDRSFPESVLKEIMNTEFNHTYEILHNQAKQKTKLFNLLYIFTPFNIFVSFIFFVSLFCFISVGKLRDLSAIK